MRLSIKQVTYLLDQGVIELADFDCICCRNEPLPSHLMLLQKGGMITAEAIEEYEANIDWNFDKLLTESIADKELMGMYEFKFQNYLREQLASYKNGGFTYLTITWDHIEQHIPELVKVLFVNRLKRFGYNCHDKRVDSNGKEYYRFTIGPLKT